MASAIDPNFITTAPVSKSGMRTQLQTAADEISALQLDVAAKLATTGGTLTGDLVISKSNPIFSLRKSASGQSSFINSYNGSSLRWSFVLGNATAESGSNAGSNFQFDAYSDAGALLGNVFAVTRSTRVLNFGVTPTAPTATAADNSTQLATTAFVRGEFTGSNSTLSDPGFQKLPSGVQIKFGTGNMSGGSGTILFGTAFPTALITVNLTEIINTTPGVTILAAGNLATTGFTVRSNSASAISYSWVAIGY